MSLFIDKIKNNYAYPHYRLLVFAKSPILGTAKTRLQPLLPKEFSLALHCQLLKTVLKQWSESVICPIECWIAGDESVFKAQIINDATANLKTLSIYQQQGQDLGERLAHAIEATFNDAQKQKNIEGVFVVGSDCPFINAEYLLDACVKLEKYDAVIGPADDGGYVLLGLKVPNTKLFKDIEWGKSCVYEQTLTRLREFNLNYFELPSLPDIDHPEDLVKLKGHADFSHLLAQAEQLIDNID
jgi:hypothetical protein